jgi:phenylpropionate dioxygenase-like ring-hydroxylating dioxygenase large terminal subunit
MPLVPPIGPTRVDAAVYVSEEQWERERTTLFRETWYVVDRSSVIAEPGDFLVWEEFGETVVVRRADDGSLSAFHNVCQHRGARIVDPESQCEGRVGHCKNGRFTCPWHGFVYDESGMVVHVPDRADFDDAELTGLRAPTVAVEDWGGWIWINLAGDRAEPLVDYLGPEVVEELGHYRMEHMVLHAKREWVMPTNWKAVVDGFIEVYHVSETHRETIPGTLALRDTYQHLLGRHSMYVIPFADSLDQLLDSQDHVAQALSHYLVFPNSIFNCLPTHIQAFQPVPIDARTAKYTAWNLIQPGGDDAFVKEMDARWGHFTRVAAEDLHAATQVGATMRSAGYARNLMNAREIRIPHFLDNVRAYAGKI